MEKRGRGMLLAGLGVVAAVTAASSPVHAAATAAPVPVADPGDTAWLLISTALVMLMTPGLAFFHGGLVRRKNVLSVLMQCFAILCIVSLQWTAFGYSLAFGPDIKGVIGGLDWAWLRGVGATPNPTYAPTVPHTAFMAFQMMFAVITPALIIGAFAERMEFAGFAVFSLLWATFVYDPVAHWIWADGGFLRRIGTLDFAGGLVVHANAGMAALAAALFLGRRDGYPERVSPPHNLPFAVLGAGLLWFGWFGFNAGSALSSGGIAAGAFVATHVAAATAGLVWGLLDLLFQERPTVLGMITGVVAGLATITPASGFVGMTGAVGIGALAAATCYGSVVWLKRIAGYDDTLDAFGVHGVGGIVGSLATGIFAVKALNPAGADGLLAGGASGAGVLAVQALATVVTAAYSFSASWLLLKLTDLTVGLRVTNEEERIGLDLTQHSEAGYTALE